MNSLFSNPYRTFMLVVALVLFARLLFVLMEEMRNRGGYAAVFRPSSRRDPAARSASGPFQHADHSPPPEAQDYLQVSPTLETWVDHETGEARGRVLEGAYRGRGLDTLSRTDCLRLNEYCRRSDPVAARLLEAYVKGRFLSPTRAKSAEPETRRRVFVEGPMTPKHAYEVLGLAEGAGERAIVKAHRALIEKRRPSASEAALINQAKDMLLNVRT